MRRTIHPNKRALLRFAAVACGLLAVFCARSDVVTGAGTDVVSGMDPSLTDLAGGFVQIALRNDAVESAFSLPIGADPVFSTQMSPGSLRIGVSGDGDTLAAHVQYMVAPFEDTAAMPYSKRDTLVSAHIYFSAGDTLKEPDSIALFPSAALNGLTPVDRADKGPCAEGGEDGCGGAPDNRIGSFALDGGLDSIQLPDDLAKSIFDARVSSSDTLEFAVSVVDYHGNMRKAHCPYVIVRVKKYSDASLVSDSIPGSARFTVFENAEAATDGDTGTVADMRARNPYSSQVTKRTAVFKVDISRILDTASILGQSKRHELMNAVAAVAANRNAADTTPGGEAALFSGLPIGSYKALILDTLLTDETILDSAASANSRLLFDEFRTVEYNTKPTTPYNTHSFKPTLRSAIERYSKDKKDKYIYIYLRPDAENSTIYWDKPPKIEAVFTPSRSQ